MNVDRAFANLGSSTELLRGGDTGKGWVEHRSFLQLWFTHYIVRSRSAVAQLGKFVLTTSSSN